MRSRERHDRIIDLVQARGRLAVDELALLLTASRETIRRDLHALARRGLIRKFHGGAELPLVEGEGSFRDRMLVNAQAKRIVARLAAPLFAPGTSLFVDTGTTTLYFAEALAQQAGLTVITNSAQIAATLGREGRHRVYLLGGEYRADGAETLGALAVAQIRAFRAQHVVLAIGALDAVAGITDYALEEAEVARAMLARGGALTVLADASKLGRTALFEVAPLARIARLVSDRPPPPPLARALAKAGVEVVSPGAGGGTMDGGG